ncbi:MAG: DUF4830 domain-containing protein [Clostridiales bacterium]|nr:DUF4830 domain-containing protein [Clostridiales bacterium]
MFVFSVKTSKRQVFSIALCVVMLAAVLVTVAVWPSGGAAAASYHPVSAGTEEQRLSFLRGLGYEVEQPYSEVKEVLIPDEFDAVFQKYNEIQQSAGMDLQPYHGKRVKCWTYQVLNYPDEAQVNAHLYIYQDEIIGGDVSSAALNGFMHGLTRLDRESAALPPADADH